MKLQLFTLAALISFIAYPQNDALESTEKKTLVKEGKLEKVTTYHTNGAISQEGYLKENKLHGKWISYSPTGEKIAIANYKKGKKEGTWLHWTNEGLIEVEYSANKPTRKVEWSNATRIVDTN